MEIQDKRFEHLNNTEHNTNICLLDPFKGEDLKNLYRIVH